MKMLSIVAGAIVTVVIIVYACISFIPPPPETPILTSPRVKLSDGRHLAYKEVGIGREKATFHINMSHGFGSSKNMKFIVPERTMNKFRINFIFYDRPGYGESDPHPARTIRSAAYDIEELADQLKIGPQFYVIGVSIGSSSIYGCLKYIPNRLAGAVLISPFINFWWTKVPPEILGAAFNLMPKGDQWTFKVAHHAPSLLYWWSNQLLFPSKSLHSLDRALASDRDLAVDRVNSQQQTPGKGYNLQQGDHESLHRDMIAGFGKWEFDPTELEKPFNGSVHIWQGVEDRIIPREVSQYINKTLS